MWCLRPPRRKDAPSRKSVLVTIAPAMEPFTSAYSPARSAAAAITIGSQVYEYTLCFVDSGRSLIADPVGVTDNTPGVAPQAFVGLAPFGQTGLRTIA